MVFRTNKFRKFLFLWFKLKILSAANILMGLKLPARLLKIKKRQKKLMKRKHLLSLQFLLMKIIVLSRKVMQIIMLVVFNISSSSASESTRKKKWKRWLKKTKYTLKILKTYQNFLSLYMKTCVMMRFNSWSIQTTFQKCKLRSEIHQEPSCSSGSSMSIASSVFNQNASMSPSTLLIIILAKNKFRSSNFIY